MNKPALLCELGANLTMSKIVIAFCKCENNHDLTWPSQSGHTAGCITLLYTPDQALFTGDHLAWSSRLERLSIMRYGARRLNDLKLPEQY